MDTILISPTITTGDALRDALAGNVVGDLKQVIPDAISDFRSFPNAPSDVRKAYEAATRLRSVYGPAAAAMARKSIELLLDRRGYQQKALVDKLEAIAKETNPDKRVSVRLIALLAALREFGNISLHVVRSKSTTEILEVEEGEVDLCVAAAEELIEELCERPAQERLVLKPMADKLRDAGKIKAAEVIDAGIAPLDKQASETT